MIGKSNTVPPLYSDTQRGLIRCFVEAEQKEDEMGTRTGYSYYHINVNKKARYGAIVAAIIHSEYSMNDEIAMGKDKAYGLKKKLDQEHSDYLSFADKAKIVAHAVLGDYTNDTLKDVKVAELDEIADALDVALVSPKYGEGKKSEKIAMILNRISMEE